MRVFGCVFSYCSLLLGALPAFGGISYSIIDLGRFQSTASVGASDINNQGIAVGGSFFSVSTTPVYWDGTLRALPLLPGDNNGGVEGINDFGVMVGSSGTSQSGSATIWRNGMPSALPAPNGRGTLGWDINNAGDVVGQFTSNFRDRAFLVESGASTYIDLGTLGGDDAVAYAINDSGVAVGYSDTAGGPTKAYKWQDTNSNHQSDSGEMIALSDLGFGGGAYNINNRGDIVGMVGRSGGRQAAVWTSAGARIDLPLLTPNGSTEAFAINNAFQIVGNATGVGAVLWQDGEIHNLLSVIPPDAGWLRLNLAYGINDRGEIVGVGVRDGTFNQHAFLLRPIPEPSSALAGVGVVIAVLAGGKRQRRPTLADRSQP